LCFPSQHRALPFAPERGQRLFDCEAPHEAGWGNEPYQGAHALLHTAATERLRHGVPLEKIGLVLRHRSVDTTACYAKADIAALK
jgi:site-specific recombinase XerD